MFEKLEPSYPYYYLIPFANKLALKYEKFWSLKSIFCVNGVGITTAHDNLVIKDNENDLFEQFLNFSRTERAENILHQKFNVRTKKGWSIISAWDDIKTLTNSQVKENIVNIDYRPFDTKKIIYRDSLVWRTVKKIMKHMLAGDNLGLVAVRQVAEKNFNHCFVTQDIINFRATLSNRGGATLFPLYLYQKESQLNLFSKK